MTTILNPQAMQKVLTHSKEYERAIGLLNKRWDQMSSRSFAMFSSPQMFNLLGSSKLLDWLRARLTQAVTRK